MVPRSASGSVGSPVHLRACSCGSTFAGDRATAAARILRALLLPLAVAALAAGCDRIGPDRAAITSPGEQRVVSGHGAVASAHPLATGVGARVLARGGNAVDAAVATGFALSVVEFTMSGLGGRASVKLRTGDGAVHGIDGFNTVPAGFLPDEGSDGYGRAAVPGVPAALARTLAEHGTWPLERVLEPAIALAERGFPLHRAEAVRIRRAREELARHPGSSAVFLREDGSPYEAGDRFVQPELARVLRAIRDEGIEVFYEGWVADSIHADMERSGGFITRADLAGYEARPAIPVEGAYRGHRILSNFRPASGQAVIQALHTMEAFDAPGPDDPAWASLAAQAVRMASSDRHMERGTEEESAAFLTSREHARERASRISLPGPAEPAVTARGGAADAPVPARPPATATAGAGGGPVAGYSARSRPTPDRDGHAAEPHHTTHLSVADREGTAVALTQSLGPSLGTRVASPGLGFLYATRLGSEPGSRPTSTISPTIVLDPDGEPAWVLGAAGGSRIISSIVQVVSRLIDHGYPLERAVAAPRVHPLSQGEVDLELGEGSTVVPAAGDRIAWPAEVRTGLEGAGFVVEPTASGQFGRLHAIAFDRGNGTVVAVAESRRWGGAAAPAGPPAQPGARR